MLTQRHLLDVPDVDQDAGEPVLQDRPDRSSRIAQTGFQYTLVASIAIWVTPCASSQSAMASKLGTVVRNVWTSSARSPASSGTRTHAVTLAL